MTTQELVTQHWPEMRSELKSHWEELTDEDLDLIDGDARKLVALVHQRTGDAIPEIEEAIGGLFESGRAARPPHRARSIREQPERQTFPAESADLVEQYGEASAAELVEMNGGHAAPRERIRSSPKSATGLAFFIGCVVGIGACGLFARSR